MRKKPSSQARMEKSLDILLNYDSKTAEAELQARIASQYPDTIAVPRELLVRISEALWDGLIPDVAEEVDKLLGVKR